MPKKLLVAWIGRTDLRAAAGESDVGLGPVAQGVQAGNYDAIYLLCDFPAAESKSYVNWLTSRTGAKIHLRSVKLTSPIDFGEIYERFKPADAGASGDHPGEPEKPASSKP